MLRLLKRLVLSLAYMGSSKSVPVAMATLAVTVGGFARADVKIQGAGATFPNPLYQKWVTEYQKLHPDVKIDYQAIGSGGGIKAITDKTVDFAGSDAPLTKKQMATLGHAVQIPSTAGAVVLAYNLPGISGELKLTGEVVADVFAGKVKTWNDPKIAALNDGLNLPASAITPAWRTDGSGTSFVFTSYLGTQSPEFKETIGVGTQVKWPAGTGGKGNDGVAAVVRGTPGSIGYVELNYATANKINFALLKNKSGRFVKASPESVSAAGAAAVPAMKPDSLAVPLWDQDGDGVYPIATFTYLIAYDKLDNIADAAKANALADFFVWAVSPDGGQKMTTALDYAPLAPAVAEKALAAAKALKR